MVNTPATLARRQTQAGALRELCTLHGVTPTFGGIDGRQQASREALLAVLAALGAPVVRMADVRGALRAARLRPWRAGVEPVNVAWHGSATAIVLRQRAKQADQPIDCTLALEDGDAQRWRVEAADLALVETAEVEGTAHVARRLKLPRRLPSGYHRLMLRTRGSKWESWVFAAPRKAVPLVGAPDPTWGTLLPLYALRTARDWGCGDFTDLRALVDWTASLGGRVVGSLPLLAAFLDDEPFEYSPYAPVSRRAWNELYVDPERLPEFAACPEARAHLASPGFLAERERLRALPAVDYQALQALKRPVLAMLAETMARDSGPRHAAFEAYLHDHPHVGDYARFRAVTERQRAGWPAWPERQRSGSFLDGDYDPADWRYHAYAQWAAQEQLGALADGMRARGARLYMDLPLGVHPDGYDVWSEPEVFAREAAGGAPPDRFFTGGQNWGFPPLHPEGIRGQGYRYFIDAVRHHLRLASLLRIDHVMGFHRLYWIPRGGNARDGVYVRYRPEEFYAVLSIESHRHGAAIVGEDLGIVQPAVREAMARHGVARMYVGMYEMAADPARALEPVPPAVVGSVETHDMPTWASYWEGRDILERQELGLLDQAGVHEAQAARARQRAALVRFLGERGLLPYHLPGWEVHWDGDLLWLTDHGTHGAAQSVLSGLLGWLAVSEAPVVVTNLEDLWFETGPQNVPGTWRERPNWRRKARLTLAEMAQDRSLLDMLDGLARQRALAAGGRGREQS